MASTDIGRMRADLEPFHSELMEEYFRNYAGHSDALSTTPVYDRYSYMFSKESFDGLSDSLRETEDLDEARRLRYMREFSLMGLLGNETSDIADSVGGFESTATIDLGGESVPYRSVHARLANEPEGGVRERLFMAKLDVMEPLNTLLLNKAQAFQALSVELGYRDYCTLCAELKGVDYFKLEDAVKTMLKQTDALYEHSMSELTEAKLGIPLADAWTYDMPYLLRGEIYDGIFEKERLVNSFTATLGAMGLDTAEMTNIHIDTEDRPNKSARAFCAPIRVPDDVRLVIRPTGGWRDYESFFHEGGHAWHFGNTDGGMPAEYRYLGDRAVTEAFAFLFNYLPTNPAWLERFMNVDNPEEFVRFANLGKLYLLRRYASKLVYELKMYSTGVTPDLQEIYRVHLQKGLVVRHSGKMFLEDVDDGFYCADYLRAWMLEGQMRVAMEEKFGESWFEEPDAGAFLRELWSFGQKFSGEEVANTLGFVELDMDQTVDHIETVLNR